METATSLRYSVRPDGVAVIVFDVPGESQNTLKAELFGEFDRLIAEVSKDDRVRAAVFTSGKKDGFLAGADVKMLAAARTIEEATELSRRGQEGFDRLAKGDLVVVAAIHGACLGGGLELALACHGRVASDHPKTSLALPEVQLGLLPGAGGTQRLPRLIGIAAALDLMLTGKNVRAKKALKLGLVDEVVPPTILVDAAAALALKLVESEKRRKPLKLAPADRAQRFALEENALGRKVLFSQARKQLRAKTFGNYPAPERILEVVEVGMSDGFEAGLAKERQRFGELVLSDESAMLRSIFFATTALKKDTGVDDPEVKPRPVGRIGMLGAGLMGSGIAIVSADKAGIDVRLKDRDDEGVMRGIKAVAAYFDKRVSKKILSRHEAAALMTRVTGSTDYSGFAGCQVVIEAVFEDLALKHQMVKDIEAACGPDVIFASNTSSLPITQIAAAASRPEQVIGMHYFSPVEKMPLLEIITHPGTSDQVTATCVELGKRQGKTVIVVRDGVGFYTSRILAPYMNEAVHVLAEGVAIEAIDGALTQWGYPVGPIVLADEVGLDVGEKVGHIMIEAFGARMTPPESMTRLVEDGRKGRKNNKGFYLYGGKKGKKKEVDASVYKVLGITPHKKMDPEELALRCALLMVNEAVLCLAEGILRSPRDGDIGAIFGLGFPPFRGGPFRYVDTVGARFVVEKLRSFEASHGARFTPAPLLVEMAASGAKFHG